MFQAINVSSVFENCKDFLTSLYGYLLDDTTNTLVPQTVRAGDDSITHITFTVYTQKDLAHFTLYLNLSDENIDYADSDTYITYENDDGTTVVTDPHGYIGSAAITVTQEDDSIPEKKTVRITVEFGEEPMDPANMVAYMWNTDRKAAFVRVIDALEVWWHHRRRSLPCRQQTPNLSNLILNCPQTLNPYPSPLIRCDLTIMMRCRP